MNRLAPRAFTLIELLIVVAVIALLVGVLLPSLGSARTAARRVVCQANLRGVNLAIMMYLEDHRDVYPAAQDPVSTDPPYWLWMGRGWRRLVEPYLGAEATPTNPSVLLCPGDRADLNAYEATSYAYSMAFYHSPEQIDAMTSIADTYSNPQPTIGQQASHVTHPRQKILIGEWTANHPYLADDGWWCWQGSRNFLFADAGVRYVNAADIHPANNGYPDANLTAGGVRGIDVD